MTVAQRSVAKTTLTHTSVAKMSVVKMSVAKASVAKTLEAISGESKKTFRSSKNQIGLVLFHLYAEVLVYIDTT